MKNINKASIFFSLILLTTACQPHPYRQGHTLYKFHCENCHMEDGSGLPGLIPSLDSYSWDLEPDRLVCLIRKGLPVNPATGQSMPPNQQLNEVELANLLNYLRSLYSKNASPITVKEVQSSSESCQ